MARTIEEVEAERATLKPSDVDYNNRNSLLDEELIKVMKGEKLDNFTESDNELKRSTMEEKVDAVLHSMANLIIKVDRINKGLFGDKVQDKN